jgi:hypothetical protein
MNEKSEQDLEELLSRHLGACLDGHLGRATAAFRAAEREARRPAARWRWWAGGAVGIAAGVAVAWMIFANRLPHGPISKPGEQVVVNDLNTEVPPMVQSAVWSPVKDEGLAVVDNQPVRQWRRQVVEEVEWYDAKDGAMVRTRMPRQEIILIGLRTD